MKRKLHEKSMKGRRSKTNKQQVSMKNWAADLPRDVMLLIFTKVMDEDILNIIFNVEKVCSSWRKLAKEPSLYRRVVIRESSLIPKRISSRLRYRTPGIPKFAKELVDRSCGQMEEFSCDKVIFYKKDLLKYIVGKQMNSLKSLHVFIDRDEFDQVAGIGEGLPLLEELTLCCWFYRNSVIEQLACFKKLKHLRLHSLAWDNTVDRLAEQSAVAIPKYVPQLRRLHLIRSTLRYDSLQAIINGCPHLEYLHLQSCPHIDAQADSFNKCITNTKLQVHAVDEEGITLCRSPKQDM